MLTCSVMPCDAMLTAAARQSSAIVIRLSGPLRRPSTGGESTTMANIAERWGLIPDLRSYSEASRPVWGTCAGLIFLAERATGEADW